MQPLRAIALTEGINTPVKVVLDAGQRTKVVLFLSKSAPCSET